MEELQKTLKEEYDKALVVMATGLGKTYLAGFFAENFKKVLFIAHREEILQQAKNSFYNILPNKTYGIFDGKKRKKRRNCICFNLYAEHEKGASFLQEG